MPEPDSLEGRLHVDSLDGVDEVMDLHAFYQKKADDLRATHNARVSRLKNDLDAQLAPLLARQAALEETARGYLKKNRRFLIRNHGKVIPLKHGTIAFRIVADTLKEPRSIAPVVAFLLARTGGKRYLNPPKYTLNHKALVSADRRLLQSLAPFGIAVRRRENLTIKPEGYKDPITLDERPYARKPR